MYEIQRIDGTVCTVASTHVTMRDAVTAMNGLLAGSPAPFNNIERHPDFVRFARFERRVVAVTTPATIALVRL